FSDKISSFKSGATVFLKEIPDPERFGVPEIKDGKIVCIDEKPKQPKSSYAVTGFYLFDSSVFSIIKSLKPSSRGELEITDVNTVYLKKGMLSYSIVDGFWSDAGTVESLMHAAKEVRASAKKD
ncbi:MAG: sugar phosphate nucleotidyltransferase, partial [Candidatus Micrarchaeia archaeon]